MEGDMEHWPPQYMTTANNPKLYFRESGKLSFEPPSQKGEAFDSYLSDPSHPVPIGIGRFRPRILAVVGRRGCWKISVS